jgi:hypothetical protein
VRSTALVAILAASCLLPGNAADPWCPPQPSDKPAAYWELVKGLPVTGPRAISARLQLDYWYEQDQDASPPIRRPVKTKDGKSGEVVVLGVRAATMPGTDFSMAFLLVEGRIVDWASCWTYNRTATHRMLLEDVDGDGCIGLAFRAEEGFWGLADKRRQTLPRDKRTWLYAYAITSAGWRACCPTRTATCGSRRRSTPPGSR